MMIVPLPTPLLDLLISVNIAAAVTLLLVAIYVSDALKIATFPTLLLLTTLFRLALEVSATRLILLRADAGEVIRAFGNFVVAGNLVVGAVIFLILTMIQFIVIAKGSERVAEVAARFTLDAMPGKQMSIDAELRAGHIDHNEARRRRAALARESQLFGAMDGAMKFVKGDAIAGIVVLAVNIVGGLVIGIVQRGLDACGGGAHVHDAHHRRGAGGADPGAGHLDGGRHHRHARGVGGGGRPPGARHRPADHGAAEGDRHRGGAAGAAGDRPGPADDSVPHAGGDPGRGRLEAPAHAGDAPGRRRGGRGRTSPAACAPRARGAAAGDDATLSPLLTPIAVEVSAELGARLARRSRPSSSRACASGCSPSWGCRCRRCACVRDARASRGARFVIRLNEVPLARGEIARERLGRAPASDIGDAVLALLRRYGHELFGLEEAQALLDALERTHPALVREVIPKLVSPVLFTDIARRLVEEGISLRNLKDILGALAEWAPHERDPVALTEHVRAALRRVITHRYAGDGGALAAYLARSDDRGRHPRVGPEDRHRQLPGPRAAALAATSSPPSAAPSVRGTAGAVLLTGAEIRRYVRRLRRDRAPEPGRCCRSRSWRPRRRSGPSRASASEGPGGRGQLTTASLSTSRFTGLTRCASKPASRERSAIGVLSVAGDGDEADAAGQIVRARAGVGRARSRPSPEGRCRAGRPPA